MATVIITALVVIGIAGALALQWAISRDGPGVLTIIDRVAGGTRGAKQMVKASTGDHPQQKVVVWGPEGAETEAPRPVIVFIHGGSWRTGDPDSYGFVARALVDRGFVVVLAGYRLGADGVYPAMLEDTARAVGWTHREIARYGGDPDHLVLAGHSAGAYNAAMVALEPRWIAREAVPANIVAGVVGLSGPYDFFPFDSDSTLAAFGHVTDGPATQPVSHVGAQAPAMLLVHGEKDTLVRPRNTRALAARLGEAGAAVETRFYPEMTHNDPLIALAAPWRPRRDIAGTIANFARRAHSAAEGDDAKQAGALSVPVQAETR